MATIVIDTRVLGYGGRSGVEEYAEHVIRGMLAIAPHHRFRFFHNGRWIRPLPHSLLEGPGTTVTNWHIPNKLLDASIGLFGWPRVDWAGAVFSPHFNIIETGKAPHIMTFHDLSFVHHADFFPLRKRWWHMTQHARSYARRAARIIAVSEFTKHDLASSFGIAPEKISVVYSGIDAQFRALGKQDPALRAFRKTHQLDFPFVLYLGTLEPRKNIPAIIRAFNLLKAGPSYRDMHLVIAGAPGWLYRDIMKEAAASPHRGHIRFFGPVKTEERVLLYNSSEAFVYPSFFEGFGLPPLESQACGIPVVTSDRTSLPEVLGDAALFVNPWRIGDLADAIGEAVSDAGKRELLRSRGLANAARFSWDVSARQTLAVIEDAHGTQV